MSQALPHPSTTDVNTLRHAAAPSKKPKLSGIEAARGIAATMVVFYHAARHLQAEYHVMPWSGVAQFGHSGVDFFFVLSGFIIFFVHQADFGQPSRLPNYFQRRFIRIYPLFYVSLIVGLILVALSSTQKFPGLLTVLQNATLLPFGNDVGIAWTLQHEILFYLIFAFAMINKRIGITLFISWFFLIMVSWLAHYTPAGSGLLPRLVSTFNLGFFFGMFAAYIVKKGVTGNRRTLFLIGAATFCGVALVENLAIFDGYAPSAQVAYGLSAMLIVIGIASSNLHGQLEAPRFLTKLGAASYSIYLLHLPCIGIIYKLLAVTGLLAHLPLGLLYLLLSVASILLCSAASRLIEYPLMDFVRKVMFARRALA